MLKKYKWQHNIHNAPNGLRTNIGCVKETCQLMWKGPWHTIQMGQSIWQATRKDRKKSQWLKQERGLQFMTLQRNQIKPNEIYLSSDKQGRESWIIPRVAKCNAKWDGELSEAILKRVSWDCESVCISIHSSTSGVSQRTLTWVHQREQRGCPGYCGSWAREAPVGSTVEETGGGGV